MNILAIEAVVDELGRFLPGAVVNKVYQPSADDIIIKFWTGRSELRLHLCASPGSSRIHLTESRFPNPYTPPRFCSLLRSRLHRLISIGQVTQERIVKMIFEGTDGKSYTLVVELTGKSSNIILVDSEEKIVDLLLRGSREKSGRLLLPGQTYCTPSDIVIKCDLRTERPVVPAKCSDANIFETWLLEKIYPSFPAIARALSRQVEFGESPDDTLAQYREELFRPLEPNIAVFGKDKLLLPHRFEFLEFEQRCEFESFSSAAEKFYSGEASRGSEKSELITCVQKNLKRLGKRLKKIEKESQRLKDPERRRRIGELLLANLHELQKGINEVVLSDFYADPATDVVIELDPRLSPQENAERYFKGFKKDKRGVGHVQRREQETIEERQWLEEVLLFLESSDDPAILLGIRGELEEAGLLQKKKEPALRKRAANPKDLLHRQVTAGGFSLYWGKNNYSNDYVSKAVCDSDDLWFHAYNMPGCHLVLKRGDFRGEIPEEDVLLSASIAAAHSRGKDDAKVEVMVTEGKNVKKIKGARPGLVRVDRYRTLMVKPYRSGSKGPKRD